MSERNHRFEACQDRNSKTVSCRFPKPVHGIHPVLREVAFDFDLLIAFPPTREYR